MDRKRNRTIEEIALVTNLTLLDSKKAGIIADNVDVLEVSIEGIGEAYSRIRHFPWEKIVENIKLIVEHRKKNKSDKPFIVLPICTMRSNLENLTQVFALKDIGVDSIVFREYTAWTQEKDNECLWQDPQATFFYIKKFEEKATQAGMPININFREKYDFEKKDRGVIAPGKSLKNCYLPWTCIAIDRRGSISCCCRDLKLARIITGKEKLMDLWNTKKFRNLRKQVNRKKPYFGCLDCDLKMGDCTIAAVEKLKSKYMRYALKRITGRYAITRALSRLFRRLHA
ncbi:MAG: SPASM domain-containing protein [Candidatus Omnitrophica bacterium]|nr:SPASM domain-containing protein [Candidatus Omnitrophota bacterium]